MCSFCLWWVDRRQTQEWPWEEEWCTAGLPGLSGASPSAAASLRHPAQLPWTFFSLLLQFIWHSLALLIHSHLDGKKSGNELSSMLTLLSNSWRCGVPRNGYFLPFLPSENSQVSSKWFQMHADWQWTAARREVKINWWQEVSQFMERAARI